MRFFLGYLKKMGPNETTTINEDTTHLKIPPTYPSFSGGVPISNYLHYACLEWTYSLEVIVEVAENNECCPWSIETKLPLLISAAPPYEHVLARYRDQEPTAIPNTYDTASDGIFKHAFVDALEACDTAPTITGAEDGGTLVDVGEVVNTYVHTEDNNYVGDDSGTQYQPVVNVFESSGSGSATATGLGGNSTIPGTGVTIFSSPPVVDDAVSQPVSSFASLEPSHDFASDNTIAPPSTTTATASSPPLDDLLNSLERSYDARETVGKWIRDHPGAVPNFTPQNMGDVLKKVTFSLDQTSVVGELMAAWGRSGGKLTCAHVVEVMQACPYQKKEVAELMVPSVGDPQNKDAVLNELDFSFYKESVEKLFPKVS